jgi:hypothetical protein
MLDMAIREGLFTPTGVESIKMRISLYADDDVLFLQPISSDMTNPQHLLRHFGDAAGLCMIRALSGTPNIHKSKLFSIICEALSITEILR